MASFFDKMNAQLNGLVGRKTLLLNGCFLILTAYFIPYFVAGEDAHITIHDNLDSNIVWAKLFLENGAFFSADSSIVKQIMNGLPSTSLCASNDMGLLFLKWFGFYWGYVLNKIVMAIIGFVGMRLLLQKHILPGSEYGLIQCGVALIFSFLPFWSFTLSVSGLPLLLYAFLNIRKGEYSFYNFLLIFLMSFYSSLIFSGFFFILVLVAILVHDAIKHRKINKFYFAGIVLLGIGYVISHFRLFYSFLFKEGYVTHRVEMKKRSIDFLHSVNSSVDIFVKGHYHAHSLHLWCFPAIIIGVLLLAMKRFNTGKRFLFILGFVVFTSIFYGFLKWEALSSFFHALSAVVPIQLQRFHTLHPMFWYVLFAISLGLIFSKWKFGKLLVVCFLLVQCVFVVTNHELLVNRKTPSFRSFYAEELFKEVKQFIGKEPSTYRVASLGLHPAVAQYNDFYTLDGYVADYPLSYKHQFRKVIDPELEKNPELEKYFDNWGSRLYLYSAELGKKFMYGKTESVKIEHLDLDIDAFRNLGGEYIISAVEIDKKNNERYCLEKTFESKSSFWKIYLYRVI